MVHWFSDVSKYNYYIAMTEAFLTRLENRPQMDCLIYNLTMYTNGIKLNLLRVKIERFGTFYNAVKPSCFIYGVIKTIQNV